jgi:hypothetical protein
VSAVVYRLNSRFGRVLYVGLTGNLPTRLKVHAQSRAWWPEVAEVEVCEFTTRDAAAIAERAQIARYRPQYNALIPTAARRVTRRSPTMLLIEHYLGTDCAAWITAARSEGLTWGRIAHALAEKTGVKATPATISAWYTGQPLAQTDRQASA